MMKFKLFTLFFILTYCNIGFCQKNYGSKLEELYHLSLSNKKAFNHVEYLCNRIGARPAGSVNNNFAVTYLKKYLDSMELDISSQIIKSPKWVRGTPEFGYIENGVGKTTSVPILAMIGSVATPINGLKAKLIQIKDLEELSKKGRKNIEGKIIFINHSMNDYTNILPQKTYENLEKIQNQSAIEASKYGALGVILRSLTTSEDNIPHTGLISYKGLSDNEKIPVATISSRASVLLSSVLTLNPNTFFYFKQTCKYLEDRNSESLIATIKGQKYSNENIILITHIDSWDIGDGVHQSACGISQIIEALNMLLKSGYKPEHTIKLFLLNNQTNDKALNNYLKKNRRELIYSIINPSETGGFLPLGFLLKSNNNKNAVTKLQNYFKPYMLTFFQEEKSKMYAKKISLTLETNPQKFYDYFGSKKDNLSALNRRELNLGVAAIASMVYLVDKQKVK